MKNLLKKAALFSAILLLFTTASSFADIKVTRISGPDRYETSLKVNQQYFQKSNGNLAVITSGYDFRTALYGSYMANALKVPCYVVPKNSGIPNNILNDLKRLNIKRAYIMGTNDVLGKSIDEILKKNNINPTRVSDKVVHNKNINEYFTEHIDEFVDSYIFDTFFPGAPRGDTSNCILINDKKFPDLLSSIPLLSELARTQAIYLGSYQNFDSNNGFRHIIGGTNTVPSAFTTYEGDKDGLNTHSWYDTASNTEYLYYSGRISGSDRYKTAVEIAKIYKPLLDKDIKSIVIVNGKDYPDALSSGLVASFNNGAILLTQPNELNTETAQYIKSNTSVNNIIIVGGESSVSKNVENELKLLK